MKALFVGLGGIGQRHLRILKELHPRVELLAVRKRGRSFEIGDDLVPDESVDIGKKYGIKSFTSIHDALKLDPDFAIVANPTSQHTETATQLVKNKIPVLMEKLISDTLKGVKNLAELSVQNKSPLMVGYMMRFHPCALLLKEYLDRNALGRIFSVIVTVNSFMPDWHRYENYNEFYAGRKDLGGGVVLTEIHELDLINWFFGSPSRVGAVGGTLSGLGLDVEDTVSVLMHQPQGNSFFPVTVNMSFVQKTPLRQFLVLGEYGRLEWDIVANALKFDDFEHDKHETHNFKDFERNDMFREQMKHFLDCVKNSKRPLTAFEKVLSGHMTALSIKKSLQEKIFLPIESI